jgi:hypothetical protein
MNREVAMACFIQYLSICLALLGKVTERLGQDSHWKAEI